jgi:hypothetical protein
MFEIPPLARSRRFSADINQKHSNSLALSFHKECGPKRAGEAEAEGQEIR